MTDIAVISYAQSDCVRDAGARNEVELIMPVIHEALGAVGMKNSQDVDFTCSGSCDYQQGAAFAFVMGVDALGAVPPIKESHVEMDAAWALYESILKIRMGQAESALIYGFGLRRCARLHASTRIGADPDSQSQFQCKLISSLSAQWQHQQWPFEHQTMLYQYGILRSCAPTVELAGGG